MTASRGRWEGRGGGLDFPWHLGSAAPTAGRLQVACGGCGGVFAPCARLCLVSPGRTGLALRGHLALSGCRGAAIWAGGAPRCDRLDPRQEECASAGFFQEYSGKVQEKPIPGPAGAPRAAVSRGMLGSPRISTGVLVALSLGPCRGQFGGVGVAGCPAGLGGWWVSSPEPSPDAGGGRGALGAAPCPVPGGPCWDGGGAGFRVTDTSRRSPCGLGSPGCSQDLPRAPVPTGPEGNPPGWAGSREGVIAAALCCCCCEVWGQTPRALTPLRVKPKALGTPAAPFVLSQSDPDPDREGCWEGGAAVGALSSSNPVTDPALLVTSAAQHCSRGRECG